MPPDLAPSAPVTSSFILTAWVPCCPSQFRWWIRRVLVLVLLWRRRCRLAAPPPVVVGPTPLLSDATGFPRSSSSCSRENSQGWLAARMRPARPPLPQAPTAPNPCLVFYTIGRPLRLARSGHYLHRAVLGL
jgi:hypothetical protein